MSVEDHLKTQKQPPKPEQMEEQKTHATDLDPLRICYSRVAWSNVGAAAFSDSSSGFWDPSPDRGSPCPASVHGEVLNLTVTYTSCFVDTHGRPALS